VLVVTIAAGEPQTEIRSIFAQFLHHNWGFTAAEAVTRRRAEDLEACRRLGADALHGSLPDCIYRLDPDDQSPLYVSNDDIFGAVSAVEEPVAQQIAAFLASLPKARRIIGPLAAGNHVDHQLVRSAAERVWDRALLYYEDYPYVQRDPRALVELLQPAEQWHSYLIPLSSAAVEARIEAILAYRSQISTLFNSQEEAASAVTRQVATTGGERLWQQTVAQ
jgi:LmbE family N-acetylglucosaminyl deacetylase